MNPGIEALARSVERRLVRQKLIVTMGGEPTFIPREPRGAEWNLEALGPEKLGYARRLARRLLGELFPGGLVMQVFGKQYPGEPLPRWVVTTLHREDGVELWNEPARFLLDDVPGSNEHPAAERLVGALSERLGLSSFVLPCHEADDDALRGWVLPLDHDERTWISDDWPFSGEQPIVLTPGKSPIGLRLPLDQLADDALRRALTVEVTDGVLDVFLPPLDPSAFIELVAIIEDVVEATDAGDLVLCGYKPAETSGIRSLGLAADPGVLEVNLPPASTWFEYDSLVRSITRAAQAEGLGTTRFHLNGQVQGTGGGAHILFGGPSLDDNPFFARPDLLCSMVRYWQRHPALSYFFSGQFVGPGSQAPRADETLISRLYELEAACEGVDAIAELPGRDFLDRLYRNLMTDGSGNTHRAEICLDKLWNHDSPTGLQGLVELRAFATASDAEVQSLTALFVRAIVAMLAAEPCSGPLRRFGSSLHDRFLLPTSLWADLGKVCVDLRRAGLEADRDWFRRLFEQRFPVLGRLPSPTGDVVVRQALEPWPLMAEMSNARGTSRVVDNSTDRIELSIEQGLHQGQIVVNGVAVALRELEGAAVAGVRYKSASGWPALHPHIPVQSPLQIDVLDAERRVVSSAQYFFWNPTAPTYDSFPADAAEAEARQKARWVPAEDRVGRRVEPKAPVYAEESHVTLDLRRQRTDRPT